ncbi:PilZ domain-containing protein [Butyrivibrio sp. JL13D10]|uniref:PilZ domain-containing protein n=1 Tax=Butyrivibrio sp. JL13D10 TaxID=3236815 RepID=UPI0038B532EB
MKDSKIKIHATINGHGILLITKAAIGVRDGLLVDSLTYFDEDLTFTEPSKVVAVNKRDGRSYEYRATRIGPVETRYGKFHLIRCTEDGRIVNRRQAERYDIDRLGVIRVGDSKDIRNALVYDISMKGIAFILDSDASVKVGDHIIASFRYDPNYFHFYACEATVVRVFTLNGQPAVGCTLDAMGADLVTLISSKKKEKMGLKVDDILNINNSPDEKIASGDKIPVNYVPQLAVSKDYESRKHEGKWELPEKPKEQPKEKIKVGTSAATTSKAIPSQKEIEEPEQDVQLMSPDEAADLIPERSEEDIIRARAQRVADMDELSEIEDRTPAVDVDDLEELATIEDRTPPKAKKLRPQKPENPLDDLKKDKGGASKSSKQMVADLASLEGADYRPSEKTKKKLDFISKIVGDKNELKRMIDSSDSSDYRAAGSVSAANTGHQVRFVDAYNSNMNNRPEPKPAGRGTLGKDASDFDGYFNQNGNAVDEGLFAPKHDDGFLTPEQIADIIELERISKNE